MIGWLEGERLTQHPLRHLLLVIGVALHLGCVNPDVKPKADMPLASARAPANLSPWVATGKLAVTADGETHTARFEWQRHDLTRDTITIAGPFSMNRQVIEREGANLTWRDDDRIRPLSEIAVLSPPLRLLTLRDPETIGQWLLGYPGVSADWQIQVLSWQPVSPWMLPEQMNIVGAGVSVKIMVSAWQIDVQ